MKLVKRGLSPVIATMLLVALTLVLATIIFLWARNFVGESIQKDGREIGSFCEQVAFNAETAGNKINIENLGDIPIFAVEIKKKKVVGEIKEIGTIEQSISSGQSAEIEIPNEIQNEISLGDKITVTPILLGETETHKKAHVCEDYGVEIEVQ
ncbi:MAG: archaellin/type IV pilin N-terminal domain-containing protein [Nanoarchaeota archaeon]